MGKLDAGQCNGRTPERLEASHRRASALALCRISPSRAARCRRHELGPIRKAQRTRSVPISQGRPGALTNPACQPPFRTSSALLEIGRVKYANGTEARLGDRQR